MRRSVIENDVKFAIGMVAEQPPQLAEVIPVERGDGPDELRRGLHPANPRSLTGNSVLVAVWC